MADRTQNVRNCGDKTYKRGICTCFRTSPLINCSRRALGVICTARGGAPERRTLHPALQEQEVIATTTQSSAEARRWTEPAGEDHGEPLNVFFAWQLRRQKSHVRLWRVTADIPLHVSCPRTSEANGVLSLHFRKTVLSKKPHPLLFSCFIAGCALIQWKGSEYPFEEVLRSAIMAFVARCHV